MYLVGGPLGPVLRVYHEQHVREPGPEVSTISVVVSANDENRQQCSRRRQTNRSLIWEIFFL